MYFQNNEPLHCRKSLSQFHCTSLVFTYPVNHSLHFTFLFVSTLNFSSLVFTFLKLSPVYALYSAHMRAVLLRRAKDSTLEHPE